MKKMRDIIIMADEQWAEVPWKWMYSRREEEEENRGWHELGFRTWRSSAPDPESLGEKKKYCSENRSYDSYYSYCSYYISCYTVIIVTTVTYVKLFRRSSDDGRRNSTSSMIILDRTPGSIIRTHASLSVYIPIVHCYYSRVRLNRLITRPSSR